MGFISTGMIMKMAIELFLGICIKLFCDNGRVNFSDFANDFLFFLPGMSWEDDDGLARQVNASIHGVPAAHGAPIPQLAK